MSELNETSLRSRLLKWAEKATRARHRTQYVIRVPDLPYGMRFIVVPEQFGNLIVEIFHWDTCEPIARRENVLGCDVFDAIGDLLEDAGV